MSSGTFHLTHLKLVTFSGGLRAAQFYWIFMRRLAIQAGGFSLWDLTSHSTVNGVCQASPNFVDGSQVSLGQFA